ncbi:MAG TPA: carboxypeptidase-like regulatory domain-containing protein, partial [Terriglobia bacterium]|nr:carboxypeptidase-like regulatory domain-containing protein [Terriglobia bacterium]
MRISVFLVSITIALLSFCAPAWCAGNPTGAVQGVAFTVGAGAAHLGVPATEVSLEGPVHIVVKSDGEGQFKFNSVPSGSYTVSARAPGMGASQTVQVRAGAVSEVEVEMRLDAVQQTAVVTATAEPANIKAPSGTDTVGESEVRNMPNIDERFQTLLPLIPGVVRGPNGLIDMKGARASQNGSLLNNADVTDPATGTSPINIPIDVVSSLQVLSTPYDPEYGKFVGAVSNLETRLGDFKKFRISVQNLLPRLRKLDGSIMGIAEATPRLTISGPIVKDRVAITQSFEYRYERDPVDSLPHLQRWTQ